jgi:4'-phosphopantetheinyl transferase EntD
VHRAVHIAPVAPRYDILAGSPVARSIGRILPSTVVAAEAVGAVDADPLFPEELQQIAGAGGKRYAEFARARSCARRALASAGIEPVAILRGPDRGPIWPAGIVGSITHCADYCCAVVARADQWCGIGIDAEVLKHLEEGVQANIMRQDERRRLLALDPAVAWPCVVFSAKEAVFKAWYPQTRRWLNFRDVELRFDAARCAFEATLLIPDPCIGDEAVDRLTGYYCIEGSRVMTAVCIEKRCSPYGPQDNAPVAAKHAAHVPDRCRFECQHAAATHQG